MTDTMRMTDLMSARRKADRGALAQAVVDLAGEYRLAFHVTRELPGSRYTSVELAGPHGLRVTVKFDGASSDPDVYVLSWHGVEEGHRLSPDAFGDVNPYSGHKATDVARGATHLLDLLRRRFAAISDGSAFAPLTETPHK